MKYKAILFASSLALIIGCNGESSQSEQPIEADAVLVGNPAAPGFNEGASDRKAIAIADSVMKAMGGRTAWDNTRYLSWNFFGTRRHLWDRYTGQFRVESLQDSTVYLSNVGTRKGRVWKNGIAVTDSVELAEDMQAAYRAWVNDSYWLVMPFKLKDSGVTLKYDGMDTTLVGAQSHVLQLTFNDVGETPQNKYLIYVNTETMLVEQWDFFSQPDQAVPGFQIPWEGYAKHGGILLSSGRGKYNLFDVAVLETVPEMVFENLEVSW